MSYYKSRESKKGSVTELPQSPLPTRVNQQKKDFLRSYYICYIKFLNVTICKMSNLSIFLEFVFNLYAAESPLRFFQIFSRELSKIL